MVVDSGQFIRFQPAVLRGHGIPAPREWARPERRPGTLGGDLRLGVVTNGEDLPDVLDSVDGG